MGRLTSTLRAFAAACALAAGTAQAGQVRYMLWDSLQLPAYRQCAADFQRQHPGTTIRIQQAGWDDYWTSISIGFIAGSAPDVFTNHLAKYPAFAANGLLVDLAPYLRRDGLDTSLYPKTLVDIWGRDGHQFGLPKDWDTVGLLVNLELAKKAGVTLAELQAMDWNPKDGGSFERVARRLSLDTQGRNAQSPDFDRGHVATYGYQSGGPGGMLGQTEWSHFAVSNGFRYQDRPWALPFHYDDPRLAETIAWLATLADKGVSMPYRDIKNLGALFAARKVAMIVDGAWMITYYAANAKFEHAWVPLPKGPTGRRASMLNGLADSMWVGSKVKEEAWQWMKYLASPECQRVVAGFGVVFPAVNGLAEEVVAQHRRKGIDASAFVTMAQEQTFPMPIADNAAQVDALMNGAIESVLLGRRPAAAALKDANDQVNRLFLPAPK